MLSNAYFLAKFRFDTAENEPAKNLQNFANFPNFANPNPCHLRAVRRGERGERGESGSASFPSAAGRRARERRLAKCRQNVARFRLYRLRFLQVNMRSTAFFKIY